MSTRDNVLRAVAVVVVLAMESFAADVVLLENNFDGNAGNDTGPAILGYGWGNTSTGDPLTGYMVVNGQNNSFAGFTTYASVDASAADSFTVVWTVTSYSTNANGYVDYGGWGIGVAKNNAGGVGHLWSNSGIYPSIVLVIDRGRTAAADWSITDVSTNGTITSHSLPGSMPTYESLNDGFTVTLTVNNNDTWEVSTTGLSNNASTNGALSANVTYAEIAGTLYPNFGFQGLNLSCTIGHVVLSSYTPPAGTVIMIR